MTLLPIFIAPFLRACEFPTLAVLEWVILTRGHAYLGALAPLPARDVRIPAALGSPIWTSTVIVTIPSRRLRVGAVA